VFALDVTEGHHRRHHHNGHDDSSHHYNRNDGVGINVDDDHNHNHDNSHITEGNNNYQDIMCNYMLLSLQELFELAGKVGNDEAGE
jgi:hypothetical protein